MNRSFGVSEFLYVVDALRWTVALSAIALVGGAVLGLAVALARSGDRPWLRWLARGFIELFQGTPVLMQLFVAYYGIAVVTGVELGPWPAVASAFTLYAGAFLGEIWRGAIEAGPAGQSEAARALSLGWWQAMRLVVLPQAFRLAIPSTVGFLVQLIKSTAVASIIGFVEVTRAGQLMSNVTFQPITVYGVVAGLYLAMCWPLTWASVRLERRGERGQRFRALTMR